MNKMKRLLSLSFVLINICSSLIAQNIERVYTKDGNIYEGFISEQIPGEYISIFAEKATISVLAKDVKNLRNDYRPFSSLSESAKVWFRVNQDTVAVMLSSFEIENHIVDNVLVISKDNKEIKYISFANQTYQLQWESIRKTTKSIDFNIPYGTREIITLVTGERLIGGIIEQVIGENIKVRTEDGKEHVIISEDVLSVRSEIVDNEVELWDQVQMLDRIFVEGEEPIEGLIVSRVMGQKINVLNHATNIERSIQLSEISKYQKFWNKDYVEYQPLILDTTKVVRINGDEVKLTETFKDHKNYYVSDSLSIDIIAGEEIRLNVQNYPCEQTAQLYKTDLTKFVSKEDEERHGKYFSAFRLDSDPVYESTFIKDEDNHDVCNIVIRRKGVYILSFSGLKSVIVIDVK